MSQPGDAPDLQFDRADFGGQPAATTCVACQEPIVDRYFGVNGQIMCPTCHGGIIVAASPHPGRLAPLFALVAGLTGGFVGALLYYTILALTGYEIGLIAIVVGLIVGRAVRWGSGGRGGRGYQVMAVAITYLAIVSTYMPFILTGIRNASSEQTQTATNVERTGQTATTSSQAANEAAQARPPIHLVLGFLFLLMLISPFLGGFQNVIGWLIIGVALWEAWKSNRRDKLSVTGPFTIGAAAGAGGTPAAG